MNIIKLGMLLLGGAIGTLLRYKFVKHAIICCQCNVSIMIVNAIGSLIAGVFFAFSQYYNLNTNYSLLVIIGFCGALTTMSSCVFETCLLMQSKGLILGVINLILNVILSLTSVWIGLISTSFLLHYLKSL